MKIFKLLSIILIFVSLHSCQEEGVTVSKTCELNGEPVDCSYFDGANQPSQSAEQIVSSLTVTTDLYNIQDQSGEFELSEDSNTVYSGNGSSCSTDTRGLGVMSYQVSDDGMLLILGSSEGGQQKMKRLGQNRGAILIGKWENERRDEAGDLKFEMEFLENGEVKLTTVCIF